MKVLTQLYKWIDQNLKSIIVAVLVGLMLFFAISNRASTKRELRLTKKVTAIETENRLLAQANIENQDSLKAERIKRTEIQKEKDLLDIKAGRLANENKILRQEVSDIPEWVMELPADVNYEYLTTIAYPYPGEYIYPFNEKQTLHIRIDFEENKKKDNLIITLDSQLINCELANEKNDSLIYSYQVSEELYEDTVDNLEESLENKQEEADLYKKDAKQNKLGKRIWRATTAVVAGVAAVTIIILEFIAP